MGIFKNYLNLLKNKKRLVALISPLLLFGSIAGFTSISCSYPFEIIKRRMQLSGEMGNPTYKNTLHCLKHMYSQNGMRAFYAGLIPQYIKLIPANCIFFYTIEVFKSAY